MNGIETFWKERNSQHNTNTKTHNFQMPLLFFVSVAAGSVVLEALNISVHLQATKTFKIVLSLVYHHNKNLL
jgi:hypothetical protein